MKFIVSGYFGPHPSIVDSVVDALSRHGHEVMQHEIYAPSIVLDRGRGRRKILPRFPGHLERSNKKLQNLIRNFRPDIVFVLRGDEIDETMLSSFRQRYGFAVWQWIYDPLAKAPGTVKLAKISDRVFHFSSLETLKLRDVLSENKVEYLPGAYDDRYHNFELSPDFNPQLHDIFFCGALSPEYYRNRLELLDFLSKSDPRLSVHICYKPSTFNIASNARFRNLLKHEYPNLFANWHMRTLGREQMVEFYRQSVVNLNIHNLNAPGLGLSWRTFEILGSGCTMISDRHPELAACFGDEIPFSIFDEPGEIIEITSELKSNPGKTGAMREKTRAAAPFHSYYYRMEKILSSR